MLLLTPHFVHPPRETDFHVGTLGDVRWERPARRCSSWRASKNGPTVPPLPPPLSAVWLLHMQLFSLQHLAVEKGIFCLMLGCPSPGHGAQEYVFMSQIKDLLRTLFTYLVWGYEPWVVWANRNIWWTSVLVINSIH